MKRTPCPALAASILAGIALQMSAYAGEPPSDCKFTVSATGMPEVKSDEMTYQILCRDGYLLAHDPDYKTPIWVAEHLTASRMSGPHKRKDNFAEDPTLAADGIPRATPDDYKKTKSKREKRAFDRGHMAPAASMKWSEEAMTQSFYMSNMAPQQGLNFNRSIWADLERLTRDWACDRQELYVFTGPIYETEDPDVLGPGEVAVPTAFYKIAYEPRQKRTIAFILPNQEIKKKGRDYTTVLGEYIRPLSEVEDLTGVRFLTNLSRRDRNINLRAQPALWGVTHGCKDSAD